MKVCLARDIINQYAADVTNKTSAVRAIYIAGSFLEMNQNDDLPQTSDVDLVFIVDQAKQKIKVGKIRYHGLLLEVSYLDSAAFSDREHLLLTHYIGNALIYNSILYDPESILHEAQQVIRLDYLDLYWVNRRIDAMLVRVKNNLDHFFADMQSPASINSYLFTLGISVFPFLLADCRNLTVRKRYAAARKVLFAYDRDSMYHKLIDLIAGSINPTQLKIHMKALENIYDRAALSEGNSAAYAFRQDIRPHSRQIAIDGCYELITSTHPKESVFWIGATFSRCCTILQLDQPDISLDEISSFMRDTGIHSADDMQIRLNALCQLLPAIEEAAKAIAQDSKNRIHMSVRHQNNYS